VKLKVCYSFQIVLFSENHRPEDAQFFQLNKSTRKLSLKNDLDRETVDNHEIKVFATNSESYPTRRPSENSVLTIKISVNDVNDNPPKFLQEKYAVGVSEDDKREKILLTLVAEDPDLNDVVTYHLMTDTIVATGENIEDVKETAFIVNEVTGFLILNFQLQPSMKGFFEFKVQARDLMGNIPGHTDEASVKIYLVAEANRVTFIFLNEVAFVKSVDGQRLAEIFSAAYGAECVIDDILATVVNGASQEKLTDVRVHFIKDSEALEASEILQ
jgi:hypothetical protein